MVAAVQAMAKTQQFSPIASPRLYVVLAGYWLLLNILPWDRFYEFSLYQKFVETMEHVVRSIALLPDGVRHGGLEYSKAQLSFLHFCGLCLVVYVSFATRRLRFSRGGGVGQLLMGLFCASLLGAFFLLFMLMWPGTFNNDYADAHHDSELRMTALYVFWWLITSGMFAFAIGFLKALIHRLNRDL
jgi:hypothetical protein